MSLETDPNLIEAPQDDGSLDDFFAKKVKKGRKKNKKTKKTVDCGDSAPEVAKFKVKKESTFKPESESVKEVNEEKVNEDDEWNDYEDDVKDYTGLNIQNLQISETPLTNPDEPEAQYNNSGELLEAKTDEGPWNNAPSAESEPVHTPAPAAPQAPKLSGAYRPPTMRSGTEGSSMRRPLKKQNAPEINSVMHFPSLAAAAADIKPEKGFQVVKSGPRSSNPSSSSSGSQAWKSSSVKNLQTQNKFSSLNQY